jgi:hypothetical protein
MGMLIDDGLDFAAVASQYFEMIGATWLSANSRTSGTISVHRRSMSI